MTPNEELAKLLKVPAAAYAKFDQLINQLEPFCAKYLNDEYMELCASMAAILARKRPAPLLKGKAEAWAAGIVRAVGMNNFLDDKTQTPYMKMTDIDEAFGVSPATGSARAKEIRKLIRIGRLEPEWTLRSRMDDNPMIWFVTVNGLMVDIRRMPLEIQEQAYQAGIIPYIPALKNEEPPTGA